MWINERYFRMFCKHSVSNQPLRMLATEIRRLASPYSLLLSLQSGAMIFTKIDVKETL